MPDLVIDLERALDGIRGLVSDLEAYYWHHAENGLQEPKRFQISHWILQLSNRLAGLEGIVMHKGGMRLRLRGVSADEAKTLDEALAVLDRWVHEEDPFDDVLQTVASALVATDRIALRAAGGTADAD
jgi:hypothetical protein